MFKPSIVMCAAAALTTISLAAAGARAAEPPSRNARDLSDSTCKDFMRLLGQDRDVALAMAHGYVLGKKGSTKFEVDKLAQITDRFVDHCLDNPRDNALDVFERIAK